MLEEKFFLGDSSEEEVYDKAQLREKGGSPPDAIPLTKYITEHIASEEGLYCEPDHSNSI